MVSVNPLNGAVNVPLNQRLNVTFSRAMNPVTIMAPGTFTVAVFGPGGAAVPGTVTYVAATNTATFTPTANLTASTHYTATVTTSAQNLSGNGLASSTAFSFTTGTTADVTPPTVIATIPASGAINVPTNEKITATFSTVMDPATITAAGTYSLSATIGGAAVAGTVTYAGSAATFAPTAVLAANTQYTAKITTAAKDLTGNAMAANFQWSFTTGAGPDVTPPTITLTNPANALVRCSRSTPR